MRGSSWATDWPKAVRGLHELAHAADRPLRKGGGLRFLPAQEKQESERNAVSKCGQNRHGHRSGRSRVLPAASRCAVPLRLATLASGEPRSEKHSHTRMGLREYPSMREHQEIISREHIRVASRELPWVCDMWFTNPERVASFVHSAIHTAARYRPGIGGRMMESLEQPAGDGTLTGFWFLSAVHPG